MPVWRQICTLVVVGSVLGEYAHLFCFCFPYSSSSSMLPRLATKGSRNICLPSRKQRGTADPNIHDGRNRGARLLRAEHGHDADPLGTPAQRSPGGAERVQRLPVLRPFRHVSFSDYRPPTLGVAAVIAAVPPPQLCCSESPPRVLLVQCGACRRFWALLLLPAVPFPPPILAHLRRKASNGRL